MKKVLFMLNNMNIGGTEKAFLNLVDAMSPEEYDVTLLLLEKKGGFLEYVPEWIHVEVLPEYEMLKKEIMDPPLKVALSYLRTGKFISAAGLFFTHALFKLTKDRTLYYRFVLRKYGENQKYDTAIAYAGPFDFVTVFVLYHVQAKRKVQWIHFDVSKFQFNKELCRKLYPKFDAINVVSEEARQQLIKVLPSISDKTHTVFNTVSKTKCYELASCGEGYSDHFNGIRIVTVGRMTKEKGQDIIPQICELLLKEKLDFRWYLIGDGSLKEKIENEINNNDDLKRRIIFLGTQANPYPYMKNANLYVQTSIHEGFCITLAEAKAFSLPIVSTEFSGAHDQLDEYQAGIVVGREAESLAQAMLLLLRRNT